MQEGRPSEEGKQFTLRFIFQLPRTWYFLCSVTSVVELDRSRGVISNADDSSARNYFTYQRPTKESLNKWASEVADSTYRYDSFLPYMKKSVDFTPANNALRPQNASVPSSTSAFTLGAGPLHVSFATWANSFSSYAQIAFQKLGFSTAVDFVSGTLSGVQYCMNTIDPDGQIRDSSESSFLQMAMKTTNVQVYNNTLTKRIIFDGKRACGAVANSAGVEYTLFATKEVIVSAGAVRIPHRGVSTAVMLIPNSFSHLRC
jgi:choline dehydrogenase